MATQEEQISEYCQWSLDYTKKVIPEYERFITIRSTNPDAGPSDSIDKLWHYHILCTELYYNYCMKNFGKIIHHNIMLTNQSEKISRLSLTMKLYKEKYGNFIHEEVWDCNLIITPDLLQTIKKHTDIYPAYLENKPPAESLNILVRYKSPGAHLKFNEKIITYKPLITDTILKLSEMILAGTTINISKIKILPHNEINPNYSKNYLINNVFRNEILLTTLVTEKCDFLIGEIDNVSFF